MTAWTRLRRWPGVRRGMIRPRTQPLTETVSLTVSGNEITDATRAMGTEGDGLSADSSFGIWEATTNLEASAGADVSFEAGTTGYTTGGTNTIASSTEQHKFGANSCKATYQDNLLLLDIALTLTAAAHSISRWLYIPTTYDGGGIRLQFANYAGASGVLTATANMNLRDQWQRVSVPNVTPAGGDLSGNVQVQAINGAPTAGRFIYIDGCQTEAQPIATPFTLTARSGARVRVPVELGNFTQMWAAVRLRRQFSDAQTLPSVDAYAVQVYADINNRLTHAYSSSGGLDRELSQSIAAGVITSASLNNAFAAGDIITHIGRWTASAVATSVDGSAFTSTARAAVPSGAITEFDIGSFRGTTHWLRGEVRCLAVGLGTLSDADAATLQTLLATDPTLAQIDAAMPSAFVTGVWTADDATMTVRKGYGGSA